MLRILIIDDHEIFRDGLGAMLSRLDPNLHLYSASTLSEASEVLEDVLDLDLILSDFSLPDGDGIRFIRDIKDQYPEVPLVLMSGHESSKIATQSLTAGASGFIPKSLSSDDLLAAIEKVLAGHIYVPIDSLNEDKSDNSKLIEGQLLTLNPQLLDQNPAPVLIFSQQDEYRLVYANKATQRCMGNGWVTVGESRINECFVDSGIASRIMNSPQQKLEMSEVKIIDGKGNPRWVTLSSSALDINDEPCSVLFLSDISELKSQKDALSRLADSDSLTGLLNRRGFQQKSCIEIERAQRFSQSCCLLMMDLDYFKQVNDSEGHAAGDELLRMFSLHCRKQLRPQDLLGRFGGEEFQALLVHTGLTHGRDVAERIRLSWQEKLLKVRGHTENSTVSIGIVSLDMSVLGQGQESPSIMDKLLSAADEELYKAKHQGRNCVVGKTIPVDGTTF